MVQFSVWEKVLKKDENNLIPLSGELPLLFLMCLYPKLLRIFTFLILSSSISKALAVK